MVIKLPKYLYRGDSDPQKKKRLKETLKGGILLTNLINGGNSREIFSNSLASLIYKHMDIGGSSTPFLSFSTNEQTADFYGGNNKEYFEIYDDKESWNFVILVFDTSMLLNETVLQISHGIFIAEFIPICKEFLPTYKVILIDALTQLMSISKNTRIEFSNVIKKQKLIANGSYFLQAHLDMMGN